MPKKIPEKIKKKESGVSPDSSPFKKKRRKNFFDGVGSDSDDEENDIQFSDSSSEDDNLDLALQLSRASTSVPPPRSQSPIAGSSNAISDDEWDNIIRSQKKRIHAMTPSPSSSEKRRRKKENQINGRRLFLDGPTQAEKLDPTKFDELLFQKLGMFAFSSSINYILDHRSQTSKFQDHGC